MTTAWQVTSEANIFQDATPGKLVREFTSQARAERYAAAVDGAVTETFLAPSDWRPNSIQQARDDRGNALVGRYTGRMYVREFGLSYTYVELKVDGQLTWLNA